MARRFLVFVSAKHGVVEADLFHPDRSFDVALNDWSGEGVFAQPAEYQSAHPWKFEAVRLALPEIAPRYDAIALLDDDLAVDAARLDRLFQVGLALGLDLWQPALETTTPRSNYSYEFLLARPGSLARRVGLVEIMCPFFSRDGFQRAFWTFDQSVSGWGLDHLWAEKVFEGRGMGIIDAFPIRHCRPVASAHWPLPNGLTPEQEFAELRVKFGLRGGER